MIKKFDKTRLYPIQPQKRRQNETQQLYRTIMLMTDVFKGFSQNINDLTNNLSNLMSQNKPIVQSLSKLTDKIDKLQNSHKQNAEKINQQILKESIQKIQKMKQIQIQMSISENMVEHRFHQINFKLPQLTQSLNQGQNQSYQKQCKGRIYKINIWVGAVCKKVFSIGFGLFKSGEMEENKIKAFCSENILINLIKLSQKYNLTAKEFEQMNKCLKEELLPYFCLKYPQTEEKQTNNKFKEILIQRDIINQNEYDYIPKCQSLQFIFQEDGNYNSQIMMFLNSIINFPNRRVKEGEQTIGESFSIQIQNFFKIVEDQDAMKKLEQYNHKLPSNRNRKQLEDEIAKIIIQNKKLKQKIKMTKNQKRKQKGGSKDNENQKDSKDPNNIQQQKDYQNYIQKHLIPEDNKKEKQTYKQKVKAYTTYQIGRKLSQNFQLFSDYQIKTGVLKLTNSSIMRIVTKWCDQLSKFFEEKQILNRQTPFRLKSGSEKFLKLQSVQLLNKLLQRQKMIIDTQLIQMSKNNYQLQSNFSKQQIHKQFKKYSTKEGLVGNFCSSIFKINQNYLINYLNLLIHGISKALKDFQVIQIIKIDYRYDQQRLQKLINQDQFYKQFEQRIKNKKGYGIDVPDLITFKVGDLLRCKFSSKQRQIIALYKFLQCISFYDPKFIKILRVKNKLHEGNKDILINLLYKDTMIVEMQLAIKTQKTKFSECANKFNHYFYEMKRAKFGPIMEMCSIWCSQDARAQFYLKEAIKLNQIAFKNKDKQKDEKNKTTMLQIENKQVQNCCHEIQNKVQRKLPFRCGQCRRFYYHYSSTQKHCFCKSCKKYTCFMCQFQQKVDSKEKIKLLQGYFNNQYKQINKIQFFNKKHQFQLINQEGGAIINLKSKQKKIIKFKTIFYEKQYYLFHQVQIQIKQNNNRQLETQQDQNRIQQKQMEILQKQKVDNKNIKKTKLELIQKFKNKQLSQQFLMSNLIFTYENINQSLPKIQLQRVKQQYFIPKQLKQNHKAQKNSVSIINKKITQNVFNIYQTKNIIWNEAQKLNLSSNKIKSLSLITKSFPNIRLAVLNNNLVQNLSLQNRQQWKQLSSLNLDYNKIDRVGNISMLENLKELNISQNCIRYIKNQQFATMKQLKNINIYNNQLQQLPQQFGQLKSLTYLELGYNKLQKLPESFGQLKSLQTLNIFSNQLYQLPESFGQLTLLKSLNIYQNKLYQLPVLFGQLTSLTTLNIYKNQLQKLPESFGQLKSLTTLNIYSNKLQELPQTFGKLKSLTNLNVFLNQLQKLPESFRQLRSLTLLDISYNQLKKLPESFGQLTQLAILNINNNQLQQLPQSFGQLKSLTTLNIYTNQLKQLPASFGQLTKLTTLNIYSNQLQKLPESFGKLITLTTLDISYNRLQKIPESFGHLGSLATLKIYKNQLQQLPQSFGQLTSLTTLEISYNKLQKQCYNQLSKLHKLLFTVTNISTVIQSIDQLSNLKQLELYCHEQQNSEKVQIARNYCKLKQIDFSYTQVQEINR